MANKPPPDHDSGHDLAEQKREFIEMFFKRGAEFTEELIRENERLRFRLLELERQQPSENTAPLDPAERDPDALRRRLQALEHEREEMLRRVRGVEELNRDYMSRYLEIERENNNLANLYVASHQLHSTLNLREVTQVITEILLNFIGAKTFAIQLVDDEHGILRTLVAEGVEKARVPERSTARTAGLGDTAIDPVAELLESGRPFFITGPLDPRPVSSPPAAGVPLKIQDKVVGLIAVWELLAQKPALVDVDFELFNLLGAHAGAALQSAKLVAELQGRPPALWAAADLV